MAPRPTLASSGTAGRPPRRSWARPPAALEPHASVTTGRCPGTRRLACARVAVDERPVDLVGERDREKQSEERRRHDGRDRLSLRHQVGDRRAHHR